MHQKLLVLEIYRDRTRGQGDGISDHNLSERLLQLGPKAEELWIDRHTRMQDDSRYLDIGCDDVPHKPKEISDKPRESQEKTSQPPTSRGVEPWEWALRIEPKHKRQGAHQKDGVLNPDPPREDKPEQGKKDNQGKGSPQLPLAAPTRSGFLLRVLARVSIGMCVQASRSRLGFPGKELVLRSAESVEAGPSGQGFKSASLQKNPEATEPFRPQLLM